MDRTTREPATAVPMGTSTVAASCACTRTISRARVTRSAKVALLEFQFVPAVVALVLPRVALRLPLRQGLLHRLRDEGFPRVEFFRLGRLVLRTLPGLLVFVLAVGRRPEFLLQHLVNEAVEGPLPVPPRPPLRHRAGA